MKIRMSERMQWIGLTALGLIAGLALALPLGLPLFAVLGAMAGTPVLLSVIGLTTGGAQSVVLRRYRVSSLWWILGSTVGMGIGLTLGVVTVEQIGRLIEGGRVNFRMLGIVPRALSFGTIGMISGSMLGFMQWLVLRRSHSKSKRWIAVNAVSLSTGLTVGSIMADVLSQRPGSLAATGTMLVIASLIMGTLTARLQARMFPATAP